MKLILGDCLEVLREMPGGCVDMVLADPPYNISVETQRSGRRVINQWDRIEGYMDWCVDWLNECSRVLKPSGVLYCWHNDIAQIAQLLERIRTDTPLECISFCIWDKGEGYRANCWQNRRPEGKTPLRSWFNVCEYCLHFFNAPKDANRAWEKTGLERIHSNPECFRPLKEWYQKEIDRLGITEEDVIAKYKAVTGKGDGMFRHYFKDSQFAIPTEKVFNEVFAPMGFVYESGGVRGYEAMLQDYEGMRQEYEAMRNYHRVDGMHCNIWNEKPIKSNNRLHTCQKPVNILSRLCRVSCPPGGVVLDPFMGSGSTGVACIRTGREFIGIEKDPHYFDIARERLEAEERQERIAEVM